MLALWWAHWALIVIVVPKLLLIVVIRMIMIINSGGNSSLLCGFSHWDGSTVKCRCRWCSRDGILVSAHLCRTSTVQCGTHTRVFCRTRRRAGPLAIPTCVLASVYNSLAFYTIGQFTHSRLIVATDDAIFSNSSTLPNPNPLICHYVLVYAVWDINMSHMLMPGCRHRDQRPQSTYWSPKLDPVRECLSAMMC